MSRVARNAADKEAAAKAVAARDSIAASTLAAYLESIESVAASGGDDAWASAASSTTFSSPAVFRRDDLARGNVKRLFHMLLSVKHSSRVLHYHENSTLSMEYQ